jgi:hypothetical protein
MKVVAWIILALFAAMLVLTFVTTSVSVFSPAGAILTMAAIWSLTKVGWARYR